MSSTSPFDPNATNAVLATILERVDHIKETQAGFCQEMRDVHKEMYGHINETKAGVAILKTESAVRKREAAWAIGAASVVGWMINVGISLFRHSPK